MSEYDPTEYAELDAEAEATDPTAVSPKVTASTIGGAFSTVLAYLLTQVPFIADAPAAVQGALVVLIVAGATFLSGYVKRDPARG